MPDASQTTSFCDSAIAPKMVDGFRQAGAAANVIVRSAFRARARHLWAKREHALARGDLAAAEKWHERLVEHEVIDWLAEARSELGAAE